MKFVRYVFQMELKKMMGRRGFLLLVLAIAVLCCCIPVPDGMGDMANFIQIIFQHSREEILHNSELSGWAVVRGVLSGYFTMFAPMIVSFGLLPVLCEEKESGLLRYMLYRSGMRSYIIGTFLAAVVCGGVLLSAGFLLFAAVVGCHSLLTAGSQAVEMLLPTLYLVGRSVVGTFYYGMVSALYTCLVSVVINNRYLLVSVPYIGLWFLERVQSRATESTSFNRIFGPGYILHPFEGGKDTILGLGVYAFFAAGIIYMMYQARKRRLDSGN